MWRAIAPSLLLVLLTNCGGGGAQPPAEPSTESVAAAPEPSPDKTAEPEPETEPEPEPTTEPEPEPEAEDEGPKSRSPLDMLTAPTIAFEIDYGSSDAKEIAGKKCDAAVGDDLAKRAACMKQERDKFLADMLRFTKEKEDWYWFIYQRKGKALNEIFKVKVKFGEETKNSVEVELLGGEKGSQFIMAGKRKFVVKVPNDYSIVMEDPKFGRLSFNAKLGLVGEKKPVE